MAVQAHGAAEAAGVISVTASLVAVAAEPTNERKISAATSVVSFGLAKGLNAIKQDIPSKSVTVGTHIAEEIKHGTKANEDP